MQQCAKKKRGAAKKIKKNIKKNKKIKKKKKKILFAISFFFEKADIDRAFGYTKVFFDGPDSPSMSNISNPLRSFIVPIEPIYRLDFLFLKYFKIALGIKLKVILKVKILELRIA